MTHPTARSGYLFAVASTLVVGAGVTAAAYLVTFPVFLGQGIRYGLGAVVLYFLARKEKDSNQLLSWQERGYLALVTAMGLVAFSVCSVEALRGASAPAVAIVIGAVPVTLAIAGPYMEHRRPTAAPLVGAIVVVAGTAVVEGTGHATAVGIAWAAGAMIGDAGFSLFSVPLLRKIGPYTLSFRTAAAAAVALVLLQVVLPGTKLPTAVTTSEVLALAFQAAFVTVGAFVAWYLALGSIPVERVGLFPGLIPLGALASAALLGARIGDPIADVAGTALLLAGIYFGSVRASSRSAKAATATA